MSKCHIIVGATGTGKSTFIKNMLRKLPTYGALFIFDVNNEYSEFFESAILDIDEFTEHATSIKKGVILIEEATIFFNNRSSNRQLTEILVRKRHTNNLVILVFHSVRSIPRYIYELSNYITVFKTNDSPGLSAKELKDERIQTLMENVAKSEDQFAHETMKIY